MRELTLRYYQFNSEGLLLLPSNSGRPIVKTKLRDFGVDYEETMVRFSNTDVLAYKVSLISKPTILNIEWKFGEEMMFFLFGAAGDRATFRVPMYV